HGSVAGTTRRACATRADIGSARLEGTQDNRGTQTLGRVHAPPVCGRAALAIDPIGSLAWPRAAAATSGGSGSLLRTSSWTARRVSTRGFGFEWREHPGQRNEAVALRAARLL